ncbi:MAG: glutathione S-transferase [Zymomonas mobilis subsp. pomaceae]|uniref:Glutathione S-transferase domain protein n=1 Tax=Zymomonas mobilis subsp. pomaceae (strain ATCC 29192 / DSM 22645 / JCM 10191 / CCUG 17912 / NBRC 13757 / NCIMB 11200 / NRRL B-4491 / Barker I) TaxID=579138 RepID=F8ET23_ZYMMT|nr:glutathione S-transferase [Zymomonas mobilis]AEI37927.1 Glutathione S-transferase domain protein [Zymomonas mobilis subsp. pomaceae ATCC 29192]MDX5949296.1 glutathione S-transferase [Zymomonas mobilis subsp. pomaceae]GEB89697.1 glutathione S-transferase [Zymomonas mobilis subsp. pomaceae]
MHIILYNCPPSGNCYKVRLFAALAEIDLDIQNVDLSVGEQKQPWFTALNPWQQVPVLKEGDVVIWDSQAILVYLAEKFGKQAWWPREASIRARVVAWLSVSTNEIQHGPADARLVKLFGTPLRYEDALAASRRTLTIIDKYLATHLWLADSKPTLADCAAYPYLSLAPEGGISLEPYPDLRQWLTRVEALPHYISVKD